MLAAVEKAGIVHMVNFSYRDSSALQEAAARIRKGEIGRVMHVETSYLQSWLSSKCWGDWRTEPNWLWRLSTSHGSMGVLGDVGCHLYDATCLLAGEIAELQCRLMTFSKGKPDPRSSEYSLDANDSFMTTVLFKGGGLGTVHSTRWATGHENALRFRIYGDRGAVEVDLDRSWNEYCLCAGTKNIDAATWERIEAKPTPNNNYWRFIKAVQTGRGDPSDFTNGLHIQAYLHLVWSLMRRRDGLRWCEANCREASDTNWYYTDLNQSDVNASNGGGPCWPPRRAGSPSSILSYAFE